MSSGGDRRFTAAFVADLCGAELAPVDMETGHAALVQLAGALGIADTEAADPFPLWAWPYQRLVLEGALEGEAARLLEELEAPDEYSRMFTSQDSVDLLSPARMVRVINVNACMIEDLWSLPRLGRASALRIVAARPIRGYATLDEVRGRARIGDVTWSRVAPYLKTGPVRSSSLGGAPRGSMRRVVAALMSPAGQRYSAVLAGTRPMSRELAAVCGITLCAREASRRRIVPRYWAPARRRLLVGAEAARGPSSPEPTPAAAIALLRNTAYIQLLTDLLRAARASIDAAVFFFTVQSEGPGQELIALLAEAIGRGVGVRLLLADDFPGDPHGAHRVNRAAVQALREARIATRRHWREVAMHERYVVVDGRFAVIGSHNWTASSFYRYDETSVCADSLALAGQLTARFDHRWSMLAGRRGQRRIPLLGLEIVDQALAARLADEGIIHADELPGSLDALGQVAETTRSHAMRLRFIRDVGTLMAHFRIAEVTAALLTTAGLRTVSSVKNASRARLERAFTESQLAWPLEGRTVFPAVTTALSRVR